MRTLATPRRDYVERMRLPSVLPVLLVGLALALLPAGARAAASAPELPASPELAKKVVVSAEGIPVGDLLALLSRKTGVLLAADRAVADDKVILFTPARPLRDVLTDLAALFNDQWEVRKTPKGQDRYVLTRSRKAAEYESGLLAAMADRLVRAMESEAAARAMTPEATGGKNPAANAVDGKSRLAAQLYTALGPVQRQALFARGRLTVPFSALTGPQRSALREVFSDLIFAQQAVAEEERNAGFTEPVNKPEDLGEGGLRFRVQHRGTFSTLSLMVGRSEIGIARVDSLTRWLLPAHGNPYSGEPVAATSKLPSPTMLQTVKRLEAWPDRLRELRQLSGLPILADYYRSKPVSRPLKDADAARWKMTRPEPPHAADNLRDEVARAAAGALDAVCEPIGYLWWMHGGTLLLRKRDWYYQRLFELPDRWMLAMAARLEAQKGVPTYGDALALLELTPEQVVGLQGISEPLPDFNAGPGVHELLAIVQAGLPNTRAPLPDLRKLSRQQLERVPLRWAELNPRQQELVPAFLETYPYVVPPGEASKFWARLTHNSEPLHSTPGYLQHMRGLGQNLSLDRNYKTAAIDIGFQLQGEGRVWGREICLPMSLPDDRRARTRVELVGDSSPSSPATRP